MSVLVARSNVPSSPISSRALRGRAERMLRALALSEAELSVLVCDDKTIHALNREHRKKDKPTDVLAFAMREGHELVGNTDLLGDVVISLQTAARQAKLHRRMLWDEVTMLLAHGLLHLVGYDHQNDADEREMNLEVARLSAAATSRAPRVTPFRVDKRALGIAKSPLRGSRKRASK